MFPEEQKVLASLLSEWYDAIKAFTHKCDGIFSNKAEQYDRESPVWRRVDWPRGFVQELRKKVDRLKQLLSTWDADDFASVDWDEIDEELGDILNYARMFAAITEMKRRRHS